MIPFPDPQTAKAWDAAAESCGIVIRYAGTYLKENWYWAVSCPTGMLRDGHTDQADEAAIMAKYALADYCDAVAGVPR